MLYLLAAVLYCIAGCCATVDIRLLWNSFSYPKHSVLLEAPWCLEPYDFRVDWYAEDNLRNLYDPKAFRAFTA